MKTKRAKRAESAVPAGVKKSGTGGYFRSNNSGMHPNSDIRFGQIIDMMSGDRKFAKAFRIKCTIVHGLLGWFMRRGSKILGRDRQITHQEWEALLSKSTALRTAIGANSFSWSVSAMVMARAIAALKFSVAIRQRDELNKGKYPFRLWFTRIVSQFQEGGLMATDGMPSNHGEMARALLDSLIETAQYARDDEALLELAKCRFPHDGGAQKMFVKANKNWP